MSGIKNDLPEGGFIVYKKDMPKIIKEAIAFVNSRLLIPFIFRLLCEAKSKEIKTNETKINESSKYTK